MSRKRALALVLMSIWIGWTLFMWFAATRSFRTVNRVLQKPQPRFAQVLRPLGANSARAVLRRLASEINAVEFRAYGLAQIVLGIVVLLLLWWQAPRDTTAFVLICVMLVLALGLSLFIEPRIAALGRTLDLNPQPAAIPRFWMLHDAYSGLDGAKLLIGIVVVARWVIMV